MVLKQLKKFVVIQEALLPAFFTRDLIVQVKVLKWLKNQGGVAAIEKINREKAALLYTAIDSSDYYRGHAEKDSRSLMNIPFNLPTPELEAKFIAEATAVGLNGLKGHRSIGGCRASIYNAFPVEGVVKLVEFMKDFEAKNPAA